MALLHIQAFGKLQMQYQDKVTTTFPTRHVEALFGYLLLYPETEHHREKLIELLWPDGSPDKARARLSTAVWRLRSVLDSLGLDTAVYLPASRDWIAFTPTRPYSCDLVQFEQALTQASQTRNEVQREQCLQTAVSLYHGDLFEGLYPDWILIAREQFARRFLQALGELMAACLARHAYAEALAHGQTILAADPLREEVHRALMLCYWRLGQSSQAINNSTNAPAFSSKNFTSSHSPKPAPSTRNSSTNAFNIPIPPPTRLSAPRTMTSSTPAKPSTLSSILVKKPPKTGDWTPERDVQAPISNPQPSSRP